MRAATPSARKRGRPPLEIDEQRLYGIALEAFADVGPEGVTMDEIAISSGISKPVLYRRHGGKDDLLRAVVEAEADRLLAHLLAAYDNVADASPVEQLRRGFEALVRYAQDNAKGFRLVFLPTATASAAVFEPAERIRRVVLQRIADMVRTHLRAAGNPDGQVAEMLALTIIGMAEAVARECSVRPEWSPDAVIELLTQVGAHGFFGVPRDVVAAADRKNRKSERTSR